MPYPTADENPVDVVFLTIPLLEVIRPVPNMRKFSIGVIFTACAVAFGFLEIAFE